MSPLSSTALSGLHAAQRHLQAAAHNVANLSTGGFRRQSVVQQAVPTGGVQTAVATSAVAGPALERDVVMRLEAQHAYLANLAVFKTSMHMQGSLLDLLA
jgi:flagellar hook protein FlgE